MKFKKKEIDNDKVIDDILEQAKKHLIMTEMLDLVSDLIKHGTDYTDAYTIAFNQCLQGKDKNDI